MVRREIFYLIECNISNQINVYALAKNVITWILSSNCWCIQIHFKNQEHDQFSTEPNLVDLSSFIY